MKQKTEWVKYKDASLSEPRWISTYGGCFFGPELDMRWINFGSNGLSSGMSRVKFAGKILGD